MVRHYHILAFTSRSHGSALVGNYLGKTSDLVLKTEADKSIDLDDGTTEVGSEKLSISFSILGQVINKWDVAEIWLVPVAKYDENTEILKINLIDQDYNLEAGSGDFNKTLFSAVLRYPVEFPRYQTITGYFDDYFLMFFKFSGTYSDWELRNIDNQPICLGSAGDEMVEYFCVAYLPRETEYALIVDDTNICDLDAGQSSGIFREDLVVA